MKRYIIFRLVMYMSVLIYLHFAAFSVHAADTYSCAEGRHEYESVLLQINTEFEDGQVRNTCVQCGYSYIEALPATGHTFSDWEIVSEATDTETGIESRQCVGCGRVYSRTLPVKKTPIFLPEKAITPEIGEVPVTDWKPNAMDYLLVGSISGVWAYTFLMLWYNGLVINWDKRERLKRRKRKENSYDSE